MLYAELAIAGTQLKFAQVAYARPHASAAHPALAHLRHAGAAFRMSGALSSMSHAAGAVTPEAGCREETGTSNLELHIELYCTWRRFGISSA